MSRKTDSSRMQLLRELLRPYLGKIEIDEVLERVRPIMEMRDFSLRSNGNAIRYAIDGVIRNECVIVCHSAHTPRFHKPSKMSQNEYENFCGEFGKWLFEALDPDFTLASVKQRQEAYRHELYAGMGRVLYQLANSGELQMAAEVLLKRMFIQPAPGRRFAELINRSYFAVIQLYLFYEALGDRRAGVYRELVSCMSDEIVVGAFKKEVFKAIYPSPAFLVISDHERCLR